MPCQQISRIKKHIKNSLLFFVLMYMGCGNPPYRGDIRAVLSFDAPDTMTIGNNYTLSAMISDSIVLSGYRKIVDTFLTRRVWVALVDPTSNEVFRVESLSSNAIQPIGNGNNTIWKWNVKPKKSGKHELLLRISILQKEGGQEESLDVGFYSKEIIVNPSWYILAKLFICEYWQWFISAILLPFLIWIFQGVLRKIRKPTEPKPNAGFFPREKKDE